jgi:hypothetical protein
MSREFIESQAAKKGVSERYVCLFVLKPAGSTDARLSFDLDTGA